MSIGVSYEQLPWTSRVAREHLPRRERVNLERPYLAAIPHPIRDLQLHVPDTMVERVVEAQEQIIRFDTEVGHITAPFGSILLRSESASSSQIENLTSTARAIAEAEINERDDGNAALIVANVRAMEAAVSAADDLSDAAIIRMHGELLGRTHPDITGRYREQQVWIGGGNFTPHDAAFIPPHHDRVPRAMQDLIAYARRPSPIPLASIAVAHAQFETIHPFPDGNGRTGRALVQASLRRSGLTKSVTVPVSAGILQQRDTYFAALTAYRSGEVAPIIDVFVDGTFLAIANGRQLVTDIEQTTQDWAERLRGIRSDAAAHRIAGLAVEHPVLNSQLVRTELRGSDPALFRGLDQLVEHGVLTETTSRSRNRIWVATAIIENLDAFARRSMRRR